MRTRERVRLLGFFFVEKISLVHLILLSTTEGLEATEKCREAVNWLGDEEGFQRRRRGRRAISDSC